MTPLFIDTHCHLDAAEFQGAGDRIAVSAQKKGVQRIVIPAVACTNFESVARLGRWGGYALGIHPLYVPDANESDLEELRRSVEQALSDTYFVAIGEIGLDFFVPELCTNEMRNKQQYFYREQLRITKEFDLPVLLHVRRSVDVILKHIRQINVRSGIAHAFNGSFQQAQQLIELGFKLGFGGAMTYARALHLRRLASTLPLSSIVLETDAPDIAPQWIHQQINSPEQLPAIAAVLAELRGISITELAHATSTNAYAALPRLIPVSSNM